MRLLLLAAAAFLCSCAPPPRHLSDTWPPLQLNEDSSGQRYDINVGQEAVVRLQSNPSTGYQWTMVNGRNAVMAQLGEPQFEPPAEPKPGAPGTQVWRLKAMIEGQATVVFEYKRAWEKRPPVKSVSVTFLSR